MTDPLEQLRADLAGLLADLPLTLERAAAADAFLVETRRILDERSARLEEMSEELRESVEAVDRVRAMLGKVTDGLLLQTPGGVTWH